MFSVENSNIYCNSCINSKKCNNFINSFSNLDAYVEPSVFKL